MPVYLRNSIVTMKAIFSILFILCIGNAVLAQKADSEQAEIISKLTGHSPINENITLNDRYSAEARMISAEFLKVKLKTFCDVVQIENYSQSGNNVVGSIMATKESDEWVVIGAHYDSVKDCPGANDNATGVALAYSVAKHVASLETRNYNLKIVFFDEEERGLIGSKAYAKQLLDDKVNVVSVHTIDQLGWDEDGDRGIELEVPTDQIRDQYSKVAGEYNYSFPIQISDVTSTDHRSFRQLGFAATGISEEYKNRDTTPHYHRSTDTYETVNFAYLATITEYVQRVFEDMMK